MPIPIRDAIKILSVVLEDEFVPKHFKLSVIADIVFDISKQNFNRKLNNPLNFADHMALAQYFELPDLSASIFGASDEEAFVAELQRLQIGIYAVDHGSVFSKILFRQPHQSDSRLSYIRKPARSLRRGPIGPDNRVDRKDQITIPTGDTGCVEYSFPSKPYPLGWFVLLDVHVATSSIRLIKPVYHESVLEVKAGWLRYPESDVLEFIDADKLGPHRLYAMTVSHKFLETILDQTSRLLQRHNDSDSRDEKNKFDGWLDKEAFKALANGCVNELLDVALLEYCQIPPQNS